MNYAKPGDNRVREGAGIYAGTSMRLLRRAFGAPRNDEAENRDRHLFSQIFLIENRCLSLFSDRLEKHHG